MRAPDLIRFARDAAAGSLLRTFLLVLAMFAPSIYVFVQLVRSGTAGVNRFGPPPYEGRP